MVEGAVSAGGCADDLYTTDDEEEYNCVRGNQLVHMYGVASVGIVSGGINYCTCMEYRQ